MEMQKLKMRKHRNAKVENAETWKCMQKLKMRKHGNAKCILWCRVWATVEWGVESQRFSQYSRLKCL
jgi:hypothetical protein